MSDTATTTPTTWKKPPGYFRTALTMGRTKAGLVLVGIVVAIAALGPFFAPYGAGEGVGNGTPAQLPVTPEPGRPYVLLGSDKLGQDVWSRFLLGGREILVMALIATALALIIGAFVGMYAGYSKGVADTVLMRTMDIVIAFPSLLLVLVVFSTFERTNWLIVVVVAATTTPRIARVIRGAVTPVVERDFIGAAEALGESKLHIIRKELLPNVAAPLLVEANLRIAYSIGLIGAMGFLGITSKLNAPNWGLMINENRGSIATQPWPVVLPAVAIAVLTVGAGLIADGLSRATAGIDRGRTD